MSPVTYSVEVIMSGPNMESSQIVMVGPLFNAKEIRGPPPFPYYIPCWWNFERQALFISSPSASQTLTISRLCSSNWNLFHSNSKRKRT